MIKLDTSKIVYFSQLDEDHFFSWAQQIRCVKSIDGGYFHIQSKRISDSDLRNLIAIMRRYKMPMHGLRQFCNERNKKWFKNRDKIWYKQVFGAA